MNSMTFRWPHRFLEDARLYPEREMLECSRCGETIRDDEDWHAITDEPVCDDCWAEHCDESTEPEDNA